jgi:hypothetical protein
MVLNACRYTELPGRRLRKSARISDIDFVSSTTGSEIVTSASSVEEGKRERGRERESEKRKRGGVTGSK